MSAMGDISATLILEYIPMSYGYCHASGSWEIHYHLSGQDTVSLYHVQQPGGELQWVLDGDLHTAVHHVMVAA